MAFLPIINCTVPERKKILVQKCVFSKLLMFSLYSNEKIK